MFEGNNKLKKITEKIYIDLIFWTIIILLFVFAVKWNMPTLSEDVKEVFINFTPYILALYANYFAFKYLLLKKKYFIYVVITIIIYISFYYLIHWVRVKYTLNRDDDIIFSILLYSFLYIGFRYIVTGPRQIIKLKNEETLRIKAERDLHKLEAKHSQAELEVLKSQVNPHFLFNSLNNIYSLTIIDSAKAGESILTLADLMRYNLESAKKKYVTLMQEVEFVENYINLESLRVDEICSINFNKIGDFEHKFISPMILNSFVENCFKHGIGTDTVQNFIDIDIDLQSNILIFTTKNRIAPPRIDLAKKSVHIGIENVKRRLELLYKNKHDLIIKSENGIYSVSLKIEL